MSHKSSLGFRSAPFIDSRLSSELPQVLFFYTDSFPDSTFADQTPSSAHVNLKQLIEKVLQEVVHLPNFRKAVNSETVPGENERTYEELLATAVINKVRELQERKLHSFWETAFYQGITLKSGFIVVLTLCAASKC
jgi:hypothetical protein